MIIGFFSNITVQQRNIIRIYLEKCLNRRISDDDQDFIEAYIVCCKFKNIDPHASSSIKQIMEEAYRKNPVIFQEKEIHFLSDSIRGLYLPNYVDSNNQNVFGNHHLIKMVNKYENKTIHIILLEEKQ